MSSTLYQGVMDWLLAEPTVHAATLFGSTAAEAPAAARADAWSDYDFHVIISDPGLVRRLDWDHVIPGEKFLFQAMRPATGGVQKLTVVFAGGQLDLVLVPLFDFRLAKLGHTLRLQRRSRRLRSALNELKTCLQNGYRMVKGEKVWGGFYAAVQNDYAGVRLSDAEIVEMAASALVDSDWVRQKLLRGEIRAAQHILHRSLAETNFRLLRELRLRRDQPLPSFGLGRHVERLLTPAELAWVTVNARCEAPELLAATEAILGGLVALMGQLVPEWRRPILPEIRR
jgi:hypothetical protein